jgi:hypothetical protein
LRAKGLKSVVYKKNRIFYDPKEKLFNPLEKSFPRFLIGIKMSRNHQAKINSLKGENKER